MNTLVLLSGGLDSVAALLKYPSADAVFFDYGQPASDREWASAKCVTEGLGVPLHRVGLKSVYGGATAGLFSSAPAGESEGLDLGFVPCRNALLLSAAAARASTMWATGKVRLVVGYNAHDTSGFPDCCHSFMYQFNRALNIGNGDDGRIVIDAPWKDKTKTDIVAWVRETAPEHMGLVSRSWSCYRAHGPCGECSACVLRASLGLL